MNKLNIYLVLLLTFFSVSMANDKNVHEIKLVVLGITQDAGYPQLNCYKPHCMPAWKNIHLKKMAVSLGIVDVNAKKKYLIEATPDIRQQMYELHQFIDNSFELSGIFLTHAHLGHYTGLIHLGREAAGTKNIKVYAMPRMLKFLTQNGPWSQLVKLKNTLLQPLKHEKVQQLSQSLSITPILVPHRDEFSETVGYKIKGPNKTALFIPDIDKWQKWDKDIIKEIQKVDYALLDATFYTNGEIPNRDMSEIPHPFVEESMQLFQNMSEKDKAKVIFIHFNHSNPLLQKDSEAQQKVKELGFNFAYEGMVINL